MHDFHAIADRVEIEALRGEFTDAGMMRDYDRFASLFTHDGAWRMPHVDVELVSHDEIRTGIERLHGIWEFLIQTVHPGTIRIEGDRADGRSYVAEAGCLRDGSSHQNLAIYHDRYQRTPDGWKFAERVYEIKYLDTTALTGSALHVAVGDRQPAVREQVAGALSGVRTDKPVDIHSPRRSL